ncbi:hypothetical protein HPB52_022494 [Rhipicephalus sanguineus]|uniref:Uncharacterized protein n=1 Tax=Rhipicephalus sanguineus TaxID=34632 RepID=A0A9D4PGR9_RHISA|nr:hypothetical protein HPB52_022494 [Rhipicephalus sanguineus]
MQQTPSSSRNANQKPELTPVHRASRRIRGLAPEIVPCCTTSTSTGMEDTTALTPAAIPAAAAAGAPAYYTLQKPRLIRSVVRDELQQLHQAQQQPTTNCIASIIREEVQHALGGHRREAPVQVPAPLQAFAPSSEPRRVSYADALRRTVPSSVTPPPVSGFQHASYADKISDTSHPQQCRYRQQPRVRNKFYDVRVRNGNNVTTIMERCKEDAEAQFKEENFTFMSTIQIARWNTHCTSCRIATAVTLQQRVESGWRPRTSRACCVPVDSGHLPCARQAVEEAPPHGTRWLRVRNSDKNTPTPSTS